MSSTEFIYFDLGNVILNFDHAIAFGNVATLAGVTPEKVEQVLFDQGLQERYETGLIDCTQFHQEFCSLTESKPLPAEFFTAISDIFTMNGAMIPVLSQLKTRGFPLGILSNTCDAHWRFVFDRYSVLQSFFDPLVLSYQEKAMKPDSKIYLAAIERAGVEPSRIIFTDDRPENVDGAIKAGIDAVLFTGVPNLVTELRSRGVGINW